MKPIVQDQNVLKEFGALRVLDGVGFEVARGQFVAIIGRSGSGKSTLLRCINGLETIHGGRIEVCGHEVGRPAAPCARNCAATSASCSRATICSRT